VTRAAASSSRTRQRAWVALGLVCVIWGTTYLAIKVALETVPPFLMGGWRYVAAGIILAIILKARGRPLPPRSSWPRLIVLGFCMMGLGNGGVVWGEQFVPSGLTAVMVGTSAFWLVGMNAVGFGHEKLHAREWLGLAIGFSGIVLLVWPDISLGGMSGRTFAYGVIALQIACAGWAFGSAYARRHVTPGGILGSAALQMIFGGLIMVVMGTVVGEWAHLGWSVRSATAVLYLTLAGAVIGFAAYSYALQHLPVSIVSIYTYVNPVIAVALGTWLLGEPFHLRMLVAAAVIIIGVAIVGRGAPPAQGRRPSQDDLVEEPHAS
jgi:drug/metabolite transporter (DMT)-like permease